MKKHILSQEEWESQMAKKILEFVQNELFLDMPYLVVALNSLSFVSDDKIETMATNGKKLFYASGKLLDLFKNNQKYIDRAYLHSLFHCMFSHLWIIQSREPKIWSLACDIAVEYTIDHLNKPCTNRILSLKRKETYTTLENEIKYISAPTIYNWLLGKQNIHDLVYEFYVDDHRYWPRKDDGQANLPNNDLQNSWQKIARQTMLEQLKKGKDNTNNGSNIMAKQLQSAKSKRNYKDFLKKFTILQEELHSDLDEFDLTYYTYGLQLYKNMPLIEAVETKEVHKISELVIVIETRYSTNGELVKNFLKETYTLLSETDSFFKKTNIRIIQCDDKVHSDDLIQNQKEMEKLLHQFTLVGGGNTDFRSAFHYVDELIENKAIKHLNGLLYFTDGKGIYPKKRPSYKTAFIFLEDFDKTKIPPWAIALQLDPINFQGGIDHEHQTSQK